MNLLIERTWKPWWRSFAEFLKRVAYHQQRNEASYASHRRIAAAKLDSS